MEANRTNALSLLPFLFYRDCIVLVRVTIAGAERIHNAIKDLCH